MVGFDPERLVREQSQAISDFFGSGVEVPKSGDWLFEAEDKIRTEKLFKVAPFYLPRRELAPYVILPGLKFPPSVLFYTYMQDRSVSRDAAWLPGEWCLVDITERPNYDNGRQMYPDTPRFQEILATLREQGKIKVIDYNEMEATLREQLNIKGSDYDLPVVPKGSRFGISPDEIDGREAAVTKTIAKILKLPSYQVSTTPYVTFNYIGNLALQHLGKSDTEEWFRDNVYGLVSRLCGGSSHYGGLSFIQDQFSDNGYSDTGFRLQINAPVKS